MHQLNSRLGVLSGRGLVRGLEVGLLGVSLRVSALLLRWLARVQRWEARRLRRVIEDTTD